jgi:molybdate transport system regulatory protein
MTPTLRLRLRLLHGTEVALGPGKADLLAAIDRSGTLAGAAQELGMSYMRAWKLVQTMNFFFREPLVATARGGQERGHASLTPTGQTVLALYREMERACLQTTEATFQELSGLLKD